MKGLIASFILCLASFSGSVLANGDVDNWLVVGIKPSQSPSIFRLGNGYRRCVMEWIDETKDFYYDLQGSRRTPITVTDAIIIEGGQRAECTILTESEDEKKDSGPNIYPGGSVPSGMKRLKARSLGWGWTFDEGRELHRRKNDPIKDAIAIRCVRREVILKKRGFSDGGSEPQKATVTVYPQVDGEYDHFVSLNGVEERLVFKNPALMEKATLTIGPSDAVCFAGTDEESDRYEFTAEEPLVLENPSIIKSISCSTAEGSDPTEKRDRQALQVIGTGTVNSMRPEKMLRKHSDI